MTCNSVGFIGCGNMGGAIFSALRRSVPELKISVFDPDERKTSVLDAHVCLTPVEAAETSDITVLAVKPQILPQVCQDLPQGRYISLAAGISLEQLSELLPGSEVIRFMPTMAALASSSPVAVCWNQELRPAWTDDALEIAQCAGQAIPIDESLMPAFIGVSGSGIAFIFQFIHALALGGTLSGLSYERSLELSKETMKGAVAFLEQTQMNPAEAVTLVTSPGGTTIAGISALEAGGFTPAVMKAVQTATEKSQNM